MLYMQHSDPPSRGFVPWEATSSKVLFMHVHNLVTDNIMSTPSDREYKLSMTRDASQLVNVQHVPQSVYSGTALPRPLDANPLPRKPPLPRLFSKVAGGGTLV